MDTTQYGCVLHEYDNSKFCGCAGVHEYLSIIGIYLAVKFKLQKSTILSHVEHIQNSNCIISNVWSDHNSLLNWANNHGHLHINWNLKLSFLNLNF